jgi:hypothetical protein
MTKRFLTLVFVIGLAGACVVQAQSPTPGESPAGATASSAPAESPAGAPKAKRGRKKAEAGTAASPAASPAPATSPAGAPTAKGTRKKAEAAPAESPPPGHPPKAPTATPTPAKFSLGDLFKPKSSAAASPAAVSRAPAKSTSTEAATNPPAPGGGHGLVWVNTDSHVYHREGSHFYGTTKKGKYMTEAEAIKEGNKAAKPPGKGQ